MPSSPPAPARPRSRLALADRPEIHLDVLLDERSAAFVALGIGKATGRPAVVLCTSGSAAAHLHPAVIEADHGDVPLLVCTADRPPELRDAGAGQTIEQSHLYGGSVRWFVRPGPARGPARRGAVLAHGRGARRCRDHLGAGRARPPEPAVPRAARADGRAARRRAPVGPTAQPGPSASPRRCRSRRSSCRPAHAA